MLDKTLISKLPREMAASELAATGRLFSAAVLREMARRGRSPLLARLAKQSSLARLLEPAQPIWNLFETAFFVLRQTRFRDEYIYKAAITHNVFLGSHSLRTAVMLTEFRIGANKADVAVLNGTSTVYEIKSERDSLRRLHAQVAAYRGVFAKVNVICGENHEAEVFDTVPRDVGVLLLTDRDRISTAREAVNSPDRISPLRIFDCLPLSESSQILKALGRIVPEVPNTQLHQALRCQFAELKPREAHSAMVDVLRRTRSLLPLKPLIDALPPSLHAAACSVEIRKQDHARLLHAIATPTHEALSWA